MACTGLNVMKNPYRHKERECSATSDRVIIDVREQSPNNSDGTGCSDSTEQPEDQQDRPIGGNGACQVVSEEEQSR
ncbi:MAG: hypothetical protein Q9223_001083 [Gallowayella weberi]